jgi:hypothetical protein
MQRYIKLCSVNARAPSETPLLSAGQCLSSRRDRILKGAQVRYNIGYYRGLKCAVISNVTGDGVGSSAIRIDPRI